MANTCHFSVRPPRHPSPLDGQERPHRLGSSSLETSSRSRIGRSPCALPSTDVVHDRRVRHAILGTYTSLSRWETPSGDLPYQTPQALAQQGLALARRHRDLALALEERGAQRTMDGIEVRRERAQSIQPRSLCNADLGCHGNPPLSRSQTRVAVSKHMS